MMHFNLFENAVQLDKLFEQNMQWLHKARTSKVMEQIITQIKNWIQNEFWTFQFRLLHVDFKSLL